MCQRRVLLICAEAPPILHDKFLSVLGGASLRKSDGIYAKYDVSQDLNAS